MRIGWVVAWIGRAMDTQTRIMAPAWRIAFGEGYSLEQWVELLKSLTILKPWIPIWRFQELAMKGLRKRHEAEPADLDPRFVLRATCKLPGLG